MIMKKISFLLLGIVLVGCAHFSYITPEFESITSSLNTPELISNYQFQNFSYAQTWEGYGCGGVDISHSSKVCSPGYIFKTKKGNCAAYTRFALYCLKKAGYEASVVKVRVKPPKSGRYSGRRAVDYHYVVVFKYKNQNMWGVFDNGRLRKTHDPNSIPDRRQGGRPFKIIKIEHD